MWYQLGLFGSRVVEAVCVSEDKVGNHHVEAAASAEEPEEDRAYGGHVRVVEAACCEKDRMEGSDASALIAKKMGISQGEVESKLVAMHQTGELDGAADRPRGPSPGRNVSLTTYDRSAAK
jgi:hypothetical protein